MHEIKINKGGSIEHKWAFKTKSTLQTAQPHLSQVISPSTFKNKFSHLGNLQSLSYMAELVEMNALFMHDKSFPYGQPLITANIDRM